MMSVEGKLARTAVAVVIGPAAVVGGLYVTGQLLDGGFLWARLLFYVGAALIPLAVGATLSGDLARACICSGICLGATYGFFKTGVQTGRATELANDFDWGLVLMLTGSAIALPAIARRAAARRRH